MTQKKPATDHQRRGRIRKPKQPTRADKAIRWIEKHLVIPDGKFVGHPFRLDDWQKADLRRIYDNPKATTRRAILSFGRKNGKSTLAAAIMLLHLCGPESKVNTQLYSSALSRDQAAVLFDLAAKMVRLSPSLRPPYVVVRETNKQLYCPARGTLYGALSADASTAMGKSPVFLVHDELGQVNGPRHRLYDALETATSAHEHPLSLVISTQAPADNDLLSILIDDAKKENDPSVVLSLYTAPVELDPFDVETIKLANPAFGRFQNEREIVKMAEDARRMPAREAEYRNLILNQRVEASNPFVTMSVWKANGKKPREHRVCYGGLDLSEVNDLTAFVLLSDYGDGDYDVFPTFWLPEHEIERRSQDDRESWDVYAKQGNLELTPGRSVEYEYVARRIVKLIRENDVRKIAFDRYNMRHLRPWLIRAGMTEAQIDAIFVDYGQGFVSMAPALRTLESLLLNEKLRHGMHPVLNVCATNAVVKMDEAGNRKLDKKRSRGRIDGMVALAMAAAMLDTTSHERRVFENVQLSDLLYHASA